MASTKSELKTLKRAGRLLEREIKETGIDVLKDPKMMIQMLQYKIALIPYEVFCCLALNDNNQLLDFSILFNGTSDSCAVYPKEVLRYVLELPQYKSVNKLVLAHQHPSFLQEPSNSDIRITEKLKTALSTIDISVADHIVISGDNHTSLKDLGLL